MLGSRYAIRSVSAGAARCLGLSRSGTTLGDGFAGYKSHNGFGSFLENEVDMPRERARMNIANEKGRGNVGMGNPPGAACCIEVRPTSTDVETVGVAVIGWMTLLVHSRSEMLILMMTMG